MVRLSKHRRGGDNSLQGRARATSGATSVPSPRLWSMTRGRPAGSPDSSRSGRRHRAVATGCVAVASRC